MTELIINDLLDELREENKRLLYELNASQKCMNLFEKYRKCLLDFNTICICGQNIRNKLDLNDLEIEFKLIDIKSIIDSYDCSRHQIQCSQDLDSCNEGTDEQELDTRRDCKIEKDWSIGSEEEMNREVDQNSVDDWIGCREQFGCRDRLMAHTSSRHTNEKPFVCFECNQCFSCEEYLKKHKKTSHMSEPVVYGCPNRDCQFTTSFVADLNRHHNEVHEMNTHLNRNNETNCELNNNNSNNSLIEQNLNENSLSEEVMDTRSDAKEDNNSSDEGFETRYETNETTIKKPFKCLECNKGFPFKSTLSNHMKTVHSLNAETYRCTNGNCSFGTRFQTALSQHLWRKHNKKISFRKTEFTCDQTGCEQQFPTRSQLSEHINTTHKTFRCVKCNKTFPLVKCLNLHNKYYHNPDRVTHRCEYPDCTFESRFPSSLVRHRNRIHKNISDFQCNQSGCEKRFLTNNELNKHLMKIHSVVKPQYRCDEPDCQKQYSDSSYLKRHKRVAHLGQKPKCKTVREYQCNECPKVFLRIDGLNRHIKCVHREERPYLCEWPGCEKRFKSSTILGKHRVIHLTDRPFRCDFEACLKSFSRCDQLTSHKKTHSKPYQCSWPECGQAFAIKYQLVGHQNRHQNLKECKCHFSGCDKSFFNRKQLKQHLRLKHNN